MGLIYCIVFPSGKKYIGQTRQKINQRLNQHKSSKDDTIISNAFRKYKSFTCEILKKCDDDTLDMYEQHFISMYGTLFPNGYNLRSGGQNGYHFTEEVKLKCSIKARKKGCDLPMYVYIHENGYRCRPPGKPEKYFNYKFLTRDINFLLAKEYVEGKHVLYEKYIKPNTLPKFISKVIRQDRAGFRVTYPGYEKHFTSMKYTNEEKYNLATNYLHSIMEKVQRLNVSGE